MLMTGQKAIDEHEVATSSRARHAVDAWVLSGTAR